MKSIAVIVFLGVAVLAAGYSDLGDRFQNADNDFLVKQKTVLEILRHVNQPELHNKYYLDALSWDIEANLDLYTNVDAVKEFIRLFKYGMLGNDEIFTIMNEKHRESAIALFHVLYYAKGWDTFYKSMVWANYNCNKGLFIYSLTVAVLHRPDMVGMELPAPYELYPFYFFNSDIIQKAQLAKMKGFGGIKKVEGVYNVIIPSNYTGFYMFLNPDQKLSYFTEDIGLNTYYYYFHTDYPFWMGGDEFHLNKDRRGELYLFQHQQLLARYYMERLSNDLGDIPELSYYHPVATGYYPNLRYYNGLFFPIRDNNYNYYTEYNYKNVMTLEDYERRIRDAIDYGSVMLPDGTKIDLSKPEAVDYLGNMIQGNPDVPDKTFFKCIEVFARTVLGSTVEHYEAEKVMPSVLEHYETAMRDPLFYMLYKRIIKYYYQFQSHQPQYSRDELNFKGVKIQSAEVSKLVTYFDMYDSDITNAVDIEFGDNLAQMGIDMLKGVKYTVDDSDQTGWNHLDGVMLNQGFDINNSNGGFGMDGSMYQGEEFIIKVRQMRLNHAPFTVKLNVTSEQTTKAVVRMYLGPKYDEAGNLLDLNENRENFWLLDTFPVDLVVGDNTIIRNSRNFTQFVRDRTPYFELYKWVMTSLAGTNHFPLDLTESHCGFPQRLMLPKGKRMGMAYQMFFIVTPFVAPAVEQFSNYNYILNCGVGSGARYLDSLPFGYPFDRVIDESSWYTPNMYYYDTNIFHRKAMDMNATY